MATPNIEPAPSAPPSSALSSAKPLGAAELQREIAAPAAPAARQPYVPEIKPDQPSPPRPDFKADLRKRVLAEPEAKKPDAAPAAPAEPEKKVVTFEAKVPAKKPDPVSADDAPPAKPSATPDEVPEEQRKVLPHDKPDTARRIKAILAERDAERSAAAALRKEVEEAKKSGATSEEITKLREEATKAAQDAARYRRMVEVEKDPEIIAKYDEPVKQMDAAIEAKFKDYGLGEPTLKAIQAAGGFAAFSRSQQTYTVNEPDADNPGEFKAVKRTAAELAHGWLNSMNIADAEAVRSALGKQQLLQSEKVAAKAKLAEEATQYYEQQTKAQREAQERQQSDVQQKTKEYDDWVKQAETSTDFLKDRPVPEGVSEAEAAKIAEYNEFNKQLRASLKKHPTTSAEYGQLKLEAAEAHHMRRVMAEKDAKIAELEEAVKKSKGALRTTPRGGSLLKSDAAPKDDGKNPANPTDFKAGLRRRVLQGQEEE